MMLLVFLLCFTKLFELFGLAMREFVLGLRFVMVFRWFGVVLGVSGVIMMD